MSDDSSIELIWESYAGTAIEDELKAGTSILPLDSITPILVDLFGKMDDHIRKHERKVKDIMKQPPPIHMEVNQPARTSVGVDNIEEIGDG